MELVVTIENDKFSLCSSGQTIAFNWSSIARVVPLGNAWGLVLEGGQTVYLRVTDIPSDVLQFIRSSPRLEKQKTEDPVPPVLPVQTATHSPDKRVNRHGVLLFLSGLALGAFIAISGMFTFHVVDLIRPKLDLPGTNTFRIAIIQVRSSAEHFQEKVRVQGQKPMQVGVYVADVKSPAFLAYTTGSNGNTFYRIRDPLKVGQGRPLGGTGTRSSCEISIKVTTTTTATVWHSQIRGMGTGVLSRHDVLGGSLDTSLLEPMTVSHIKTNWPGEYPVGSDIPLADLGDYKVLLTTSEVGNRH